MIPGKRYSPADFLAIVRRRFWLVVVPLVIASGATYFIAKSLPNSYRSETLILVVPQRVPETYVKSTVTSRIEDRLHSISQQILSRTNLERIIQDFNLYAPDRRTRIMEDIVEQMRHDIVVQVIKGDSFRVSYAGGEPRSVMQVTQRLATLFIEENLRDRENLAEGSYQFLEAQLEEARRRLVEQEKRLEEYRRRYSGELPTQLQGNLQAIQNNQMQIQALIESMARDRDRRLMLERSIADLANPETVTVTPPAPAQTIGADPGVGFEGGTTSQQLEAARQSLRQLEIRLKPEHPDLIRMKRSVATLGQKVAEETAQAQAAAAVLSAVPAPVRALNPADLARQNRLRDLRTELERLDREFARKEEEQRRLQTAVSTYQARVEATPGRESEMTELTRDYGTQQKAYTDLLMKKEDSKVAANMERNQIGEQFKILDAARLPEKPYSPNRPQIMMIGAAIGLLLGLGLVALLEFADSTFKTDDDILLALSLPVLAIVPKLITSIEKRRATKRRRLLAFASSTVLVLVAGALIIWKLRT